MNDCQKQNIKTRYNSSATFPAGLIITCKCEKSNQTAQIHNSYRLDESSMIETLKLLYTEVCSKCKAFPKNKTQIRCEKCGKLLFNVNANMQQDSQVEIEIKCPHRVKKDGKNVPCNTINIITF